MTTRIPRTPLSMLRRFRREPRTTAVAAGLGAAALAAAGLAGCSVNPATGKNQLNLYSEAQEIAMGREADEQIVAELGLVDDDGLQAMVGEIGRQLARSSERPGLPWTFRVVDDPVVNAFALPGGFVYVTRGMLAHMGSEAELAGVLGHEIGHVTARHGVNRLSKAQLATVGLGIGMVASPELARFGDVLQTSLGLLFLKFSRDDERQADELGFRYVVDEGFSPFAMAEVFATLDRVSESAGGRVPGWLATHPPPGNRRETIARAAAGAPDAVAAADWRREPYLRRLENMVYGPDPREGYFVGSAFHHPDMAFRLDFPDGWTTRNQKQAVLAVSPEQDAILALTLVAGDSPEDAAREFFGTTGLEVGGDWVEPAALAPGVSRRFRTTGSQQELTGAAVFGRHGGRTFRLIGYATTERWPLRDEAVAATFRSFARVTDPAVLGVEPLRLRIVEVDRATTLAELHRRWRPPIELDELALVNGRASGDRIEAGTRVKRVIGKLPGR